MALPVSGDCLVGKQSVLRMVVARLNGNMGRSPLESLKSKGQDLAVMSPESFESPVEAWMSEQTYGDLLDR